MKAICRLVGATSVLALACVMGAAPAMAQDAVVADAQTAASDDAGQMQDIIVSARRRNESIQTTPVALTAIQPAQLEARAAVDIQQISGSAPNVVINQVGSGVRTAAISIRGISLNEVEKSSDPAIGVLIDGVYLGTTTGTTLDFFDIDSVEVLRGPQGTLFGRNTIGGVINVRRSKPTGEWGGKFSVGYSSFNSFEARGVLQVPIVDDVLALKLFQFHKQTDGFYRRADTGKHSGGENSENFGVVVRVTPTSNFEALLTVEKQVADGKPVVGTLSNSTDLICSGTPNIAGAPAVECNRSERGSYTDFTGTPGLSSYRAPALTLEMNWDLGGVKLASVTSYRTSRDRAAVDIDGSSIVFYEFDRDQRYKQFSQELRLSGNITPDIDYVAGVYYFDSKYTMLQRTVLGPLLTGAPGPVEITPQDTTGLSQSYAVFADADWKFADGWRLSVGGRFTHDRKELTQTFPGVFTATGKANFSKFTPKVSLDYRPNNDLMVYASYSKGFRSGGFNGRAATPFSVTTPYAPENVTAYELGLKSELFDRRVVVNLAAFYTDYQDIQSQTIVPTPPGSPNPQETLVVNAAAAKIKGLEADITARLAPGLTLGATAGYTDSHFKDFIVNNGTLDASAVRLPFATKFNASVNLDQSIEIGSSEIKVHAGYRHISPYDTMVAPFGSTLVNGVQVAARNDPRARASAQDLLDLNVTLLHEMFGGKARVSVFARNVLDDRGVGWSAPVAGLFNYVNPREPRVVGAQLGFEF